MSIGAPRRRQLREDVGAVAEQADRQRPFGARRELQRVVDVVGLDVQVARREPALDAGRVDLDADRHAAGHRHRERLRAAHPAQAAGERDRAGQGAAVALVRDRRERLVRALQDALGADVDPRARGHLAVHRQPERLEAPELVPVRPVADQVGVRDQHARRPLVRLHDADGLAGLHQQRLVVRQRLQRPRDRVERVPVARGLARAAVDDELVGVLGDVGVQVVVEHAQGGFLLPAPAGQLGASGGADDGLHASSPVIASAALRAPPDLTKSVAAAISARGSGRGRGGCPGRR